MAANLRIYRIKGGTYFLLEESLHNITGTPLLTVAKNGNNNQRAGIYDLTFTSVSPGVQATCIVNTADPHDPSRNLSGSTVTLDGVTIHKNLIQGLELVFSDSASFNSSWHAKIYYGAFFDPSDSSENSITRFGQIVAGQDSTAFRLAVRNDGGDLAASSTVKIVNGVYVVPLSGSLIKTISYTQQNPTANFAPGYAITTANLVAGSPATIDILVDGANYNITRLDTGVQYPGGAAVPADGATLLQWTAGPLAGLQFVLNTSAANTDAATFFVSDGARLVQVAPDISGTAGVYQAGTTALVLTEDGSSTVGEIPASTTAFFWMKIHSLGTDSPVGNERFFRAILEGLGV